MESMQQKSATQDDQEEQIDTSSKVFQNRTPKLNLKKAKFGQSKKPPEDQQQVEPVQIAPEEKGSMFCPIDKCGRRFDTPIGLREHIMRRHAAPSLDSKATREKQQKRQPPQQEVLVINHEESKGEDGHHGFTAAPKLVGGQSGRNSSEGVQTTSPKKVRQRPTTAGVSRQVGSEQAALLKAMHGSATTNPLTRPRTAATSTLFDESRIKDKLKYLEEMEAKITNDIDEVMQNRDFGKQSTGEHVTKQMILQGAMNCEDLAEVQTLMLREKNIEILDDNNRNGPGKFKMTDLCNVECVLASHNLIKSIDGICQLTTLVELNLSFNQIIDITGIQELTLLKNLQLSHNRIMTIDPIQSLKGLKNLGLYFNQITNKQRTIDYLEKLPKLSELSIDGNECASKIDFKYELILKCPKLKIFNDLAVKELDRDVAEQYFEMNGLSVPKPHMEVNSNITQKSSKNVRFNLTKGDQEDESDWQNEEINKLQKRVYDIAMENMNLQRLLDAKHYTDVYKENERMKKELMNMDILLEENQELHQDLERLKRLTYEDRMKEMAEENAKLRRRNGELLINNADLEEKIAKLKKELAFIPNAGQVEKEQSRPMRPSTAKPKYSSRTEMLDDEDMDSELSEMIAENQQRMQELRSDLKDVNKITDGTYINVRKIKKPRKIQGTEEQF